MLYPLSYEGVTVYLDYRKRAYSLALSFDFSSVVGLSVGVWLLLALGAVLLRMCFRLCPNVAPSRGCDKEDRC